MATQQFGKRTFTAEELTLVDEFVSAAILGNRASLRTSLVRLDLQPAVLFEAFRKIGQLLSAHDDVKQFFPELWVAYGDHIRMEFDDDTVLLDALRALMPRYNGPSVQLFRGDQAANHRRNTYGISWSASKNTAEHFARFYDCRLASGGSVLLTAFVEPEAIICSFGNKVSGEDEYLLIDGNCAGCAY